MRDIIVIRNSMETTDRWTDGQQAGGRRSIKMATCVEMSRMELICIHTCSASWWFLFFLCVER